MKWTRTVLIGGIAFSIALFSCSKTDENDVNSTDQTFLMQASVSNTAEIQAGALASTKGNSAGVKSFGAMMVTEHTMAQTDLKTTGANVGIAVKDSVDPVHVALMQQLNALSGRAFDSVYIKNQITDHQNTLNLFQTELNSGSHQQVKSYASTYQPHIQMHYHMADSIATAMKFK